MSEWPYDGYETDADLKADGFADGWAHLQDQLSQDEQWAQHIYYRTHGEW